MIGTTEVISAETLTAVRQRLGAWDRLVQIMAGGFRDDLEKILADVRDPGCDFDKLHPDWPRDRRLVEAAAAEALATISRTMSEGWQPPEAPSDDDLAEIPAWVARQIAACDKRAAATKQAADRPAMSRGQIEVVPPRCGDTHGAIVLRIREPEDPDFIGGTVSVRLSIEDEVSVYQFADDNVPVTADAA